MADKWGTRLIASPGRLGRMAVVAGLGLSLSACAQGGLSEIAGLNKTVTPGTAAPKNGAQTQPMGQSELAKATEYWGKKFSSNPRNAEYAVNYARNLKAMKQKRRALAVLQQASIFNGKNADLASEYGRLALDLGQTGLAAKILAKVDNPTRPDWRIISARGTALAKQGRQNEAMQFFERAIALAPDKPSVMNNLAMAYVMDGQPAKAEPLLRKAALTASPDIRGKIQQNLSLALGLQGKYDEAKTVSEPLVGQMNAASNVAAIRKLVKLKPQLSPAARADKIIQLAKAASARSGKTKRGHTSRLALRRAKIKPAATARAIKPSALAQNSPTDLRAKTMY